MTTRKIIIWSVVGLVLLLLANSGCSNYNKIVTKEESKNESWGNVQNAYERRAALIPQLVNVVESYANFEKSTFEAVAQARANANNVKIDPTNLTPEALAKFDAAQGSLGQTLSRLMVVMEKYPELKANDQFMNLQTELAGTENRIAVERRRFNAEVKDFNQTIRKIPASLWAGMFGFQTSAYFEADAAAQKAPTVKMNIR